jgi:hypothetical protein
MGCNSTHGITNYTYWRWSTTGSGQAAMSIGPAAAPRTGNEIDFGVAWCKPPNPNPKHEGCYRSELAVVRAQDKLVDWKAGVGSSERWFGFSNRLLNFSFDSSTPLNGPSFQLHGGGGLPSLKRAHPNLNLQVDATGCALGNNSCPVWTLGISSTIDNSNNSARCSEKYPLCFVLGPAAAADGRFDHWNDWVIQWRGSPQPALGHVAVWRDGRPILPLQRNIATAYNDTVAPYVKFGVYRGSWKGPTAPTRGNFTSIAYAAMRVGDETSSFEEVSTALGG